MNLYRDLGRHVVSRARKGGEVVRGFRILSHVESVGGSYESWLIYFGGYMMVRRVLPDFELIKTSPECQGLHGLVIDMIADRKTAPMESIYVIGDIPVMDQLTVMQTFAAKWPIAAAYHVRMCNQYVVSALLQDETVHPLVRAVCIAWVDCTDRLVVTVIREFLASVHSSHWPIEKGDALNLATVTTAFAYHAALTRVGLWILDDPVSNELMLQTQSEWQGLRDGLSWHDSMPVPDND